MNSHRYHMSANNLVYVFLCCSAGFLKAGPDNIAPLASISASTELNNGYDAHHAIDGIIGVAEKGEWACQGATIFWGYIRYPWIQLEWDMEQDVDKVILYDRPALSEHTAGGTLLFSDGSEVVVTSIPNDGTAKVVEFSARKVKWIRFQVTDGDGSDLGLSEIEVFPATDFQDFVSWVDPFIETTKGRYFFFTPGSRPFGMIATAPHTRIKNQWGGGYNYNSMEILGFGQLHGWMMSGIDVMPTTGLINPSLGRDAWKSTFSHDDEIAQPGYQRVHLRKYKTWVENTVTDRVSLYRYRFTEDNEAGILVNLGGYMGSTTMTKAKVTKVGDREMVGSFVSAGRMWGGPKEIEVYFVIQFDQPYDRLDGWIDQDLITDITTLEGPSALTRMDSVTFGNITQSYFSAPSTGVNARYHMKAGEELLMKVAISYVSIENARENLRHELDHWDFDAVRSDSRKIWNDWLGRIEVKGGTHKQRVKFYTDLWHVLLGRQIIDDVNGEYPDYTQGKLDWKFTDAHKLVKKLPTDGAGQVRYHMYNSDALWLTQWNLNILWGLAWPEILDDFSASMVQYADNGGLLPRGPCVGGYSYIMTGCPATNMIVSAYMKDMLKKVDPVHALETIVRNHQPGGMMGDDERLKFYIEHGWCPGNAGETVEWSFQDWVAAQMAKKMGKETIYREFIRRSQGWKKIYRPEQGLLFPKQQDGSWLHDDPLSGSGWIEANAWQGTWSVSHDIASLASLMGGQEALCEKLNHAFEQAAPDDFVFGYSSGYVSYANQPGCSNAHVFNHAGQPWLSQYWVRRVNEQAYGGTTPDRGYGGHDEDQGQMGGVSALMSMGLFSLRGNTTHEPVYEITSPIFDEVIIHLDPAYHSGHTFTIKTHGNEKGHLYIQKAMLNGGEHKAAWIKHETYHKGGVLELWLGEQPNREWGLEPIP